MSAFYSRVNYNASCQVIALHFIKKYFSGRYADWEKVRLCAHDFMPNQFYAIYIVLYLHRAKQILRITHHTKKVKHAEYDASRLEIPNLGRLS